MEKIRLKKEIIDNSLLEYSTIFRYMMENSRKLKKLTDENIELFIKDYMFSINNSDEGRSKVVKNQIEYIEDFVKKLKTGLISIKIENKETEKQRKERQKKQQKTYTTTTAGIYVSEILNRNKPLSKVSINDRIKNGQLRSEKVGNRNIIYQNDLDDFIKKYGDTIRN